MSLEGHKAGKENPIATYILVTRVNYCSVLKENSKHFAFFLSLQKEKAKKWRQFYQSYTHEISERTSLHENIEETKYIKLLETIIFLIQ